MIDHATPTRPDRTPAERAVRYLLERIRMDPDLRWLMLDTQAMHLLCAGEAAITGRDVEAVQAEYRRPFDHPEATRTPRLKHHGDLVRAAERVADAAADGDDLGEWIDDLRKVVRKALGE
jgi:hypothetical protein